MAMIKVDLDSGVELHREPLYFRDGSSESCDWCGNTGMRLKSGPHAWTRRLWVYLTEDENLNRGIISGNFCCLDCMRRYHGKDEQ